MIPAPSPASLEQPPVAPKRPRHLLDPNDIRGSHQRSQGSAESLTQVQRWVMSVLAVTTILHLAGGTVLVAVLADAARLDARIGLNVIASVIGVVAVATGLLIHGRRPLSGWLLLGLLPGIVGAWLTF
jgi:hypothetical protein